MLANFKKIFFIALAVVVFAPAAQSSDLFTAKNIYVDVTDRNSEISRKKALVIAQSRAFDRIIKRIVKASDIEFLPEFSSEEIGYLLKEVSVVKESTSPVRYVATLNVSFDDEKIKSLLADLGISFVLSSAKPYLILPFYDVNGKIMDFTSNPWQNVWTYNAPDNALTPLYRVRSGTDISYASLNNNKLKDLAKSYRAEGTIVAHVTKTYNNELKLRYNRYINGSLMERYEHVIEIENGDEKSALVKMANYIGNRREAGWRESMAVNVGAPELMVIVVPLQSLAHLNQIDSRISKIPLIARYELKAVKQDRAQINIWHSALLDDLKRAFRKQNLSLMEISENVYGVRDLKIPTSKQKIELSNDDKENIDNTYQHHAE